ncbi:hypothetical protein OO015_00685 [Thermomicrobium sp. 4228-Ro]|uniref:hypothetical protein n=1 Tax=Thermomicrobium sp. 4228-Ro TaxID=2993937 RepID=UPI0022488483|nr:hypothetical protein [Thermomicrobium sp. 4228-Ro]MCX2726023.1 hypothetical protein [Thermomicrobium sp. 4228-Ro]
MKQLIAIAGKSGAGKSTLAEALAVLYDLPRDSFATPIRWALQELGVAAPYPRRLMQRLGRCLRDEDPDHFVKLLALRNPAFSQTGLVIDDVRYENEYRWLRDHGFVLIYLKGSFRPLEGEEAEDESETALSPERVRFDLVLPAGSSVVQRVAAVSRLLRDPALSPVA